MVLPCEFLWYVPNSVESGHRGDDTTVGWGSLDYSVELAQLAESHGWRGALIGTGWGRPDTLTVATALVARTMSWRAAHDRLAVIAARPDDLRQADPAAAVGQRRLADLAEHGDVLDSCLFTAPVRYGGAGAGSSWLVGSAAEVAAALRAYADLGVTHFVLSDTPYKSEVVRIGNQVLPLL